MSKFENNLLLFSITLWWAASYVFIKELPSSLSDFAYLTFTCGIAAVVWGIIDAVLILTDKVRDPEGRPLRDGT